MKSKNFTFQGSDGAQIAGRAWLPDDDPRGVVQIIHGKAEHSARYGHFAEYLCRHGVAVYANDLRGHGESARTEEALGFFAEQEGWRRVEEDLFILSERIRLELPGKPLFLLGHSMGSLFARCTIADHAGFAGCILSGVVCHPGLLGYIGGMLIAREIRSVGPHATSPKLEALTTGGLNRQFRPSRTDFDWLSRDAGVVDAYIVDPKCGFVAQAGFYRDFLQGILAANSPGCVARTPKELPLLFLVGERDPVGANGKKVRGVIRKFQRAGVRDVAARFYPEGRHEVLNETDRERVYADVLSWLDTHLRLDRESRSSR